jgi:hypothetical protein
MLHIILTKDTNNAIAATRPNLPGISADRTQAEALLFLLRCGGRSEDPNSRQFARFARTTAHLYKNSIPGTLTSPSSTASGAARVLPFADHCASLYAFC